MEQTLYVKGKLYRLAKGFSPANPRPPRMFSKVGDYTYVDHVYVPKEEDVFLCLGDEAQFADLYVRFLHVNTQRYIWVKIERTKRNMQNRKRRLVEVR